MDGRQYKDWFQNTQDRNVVRRDRKKKHPIIWGLLVAVLFFALIASWCASILASLALAVLMGLCTSAAIRED